jgi:hypothetical protein
MALAVAGRSRCLTSMPPALRAAVFRRCFHMAPLEPKTKDILDGIFEGNRTMLARGITLGMDSLSLTISTEVVVMH